MLLVHPSGELYGSDRMLLQTVRALSTDWDVSVVLCRTGPLQAALRAAGARVEVLDFPVLHKRMFGVRGLARTARATLTGVPAGLRLLIRARPELVYVNTLTVPLWLVLARCAGVPAICHVHEAEDALPRPARWLLAAPLRWADQVVTNSEVARDVLVDSDPGLRGRCRVLHNGVAGPTRDVAPLRPRLTGDVRLLLVGRLSWRKGSDLAIDAVRLLLARGVPVHLVLAGGGVEGDPRFAEGLRERVRRGGLGARVSFAGFRSDVWSLHDEADIVLVPSRTEPFGNVAVEGMLAGRPVVCAAAAGLTEIVRDGETGLLVPVGDAAALAAAVHRLVRDWQAARVLAAAGRSAAVQRFGAERYADDLRALTAGYRVGRPMTVR